MASELRSAICLSDDPEATLMSAASEIGVSVFHINDMAQADALLRVSPKGWDCIFVVIANMDDLVRHSPSLLSFKRLYPSIDIVICSGSQDTLHLLNKLPDYGVNVLRLPADRSSLTRCIADLARRMENDCESST